jgi:hypothetical protein
MMKLLFDKQLFKSRSNTGVRGMPFISVLDAKPSVGITKKPKAWSCWQRGLISATHLGYDYDVRVDKVDPQGKHYDVWEKGGPSWLGHVAVGRGHNAVRVFMNFSADGYWLTPVDHVRIGNSFAKVTRQGGTAQYSVRAASDVWSDPLWSDVTWPTAADLESGTAWRDPQLDTSRQGWARNDINAVHCFYRNYDGGQPRSDAASGRLLPAGAKRINETEAVIRRFLDQCASMGVGVILTLQFWQSDWDRLWNDSAANAWTEGAWNPTTQQFAQDSLVMFWMATAANFGSHPAVIGYDILNEPNPKDMSSWSALASTIVNEIRKIDTQTPILLEGASAGTAEGLAAFAANSPLVTGANSKLLVFSFHAYAPYHYTHQGLTNGTYESVGLGYPMASLLNEATQISSSLGTPAQLAALYKPALDFKAKYNVAMFVGEFSAIDAALASRDGYTMVDATSANRAVTSIEVNGRQLTLTVGNLKYQGGVDGPYGFSINMSNTAASVLNGLSQPERNARCTNTVLVTLSKLSPAQRDQSLAFGTTARAVSEDDYSAIDKKIDALNIMDKPLPATIYRSGSAYVLTLDAAHNASDGVPEFAAIKKWMVQKEQGKPDMVEYRHLPAIASISIQPSSQNPLKNDESRTLYAKHVLIMCQSNGLSWSWLGDNWYETPTRELFWSPSATVREQLRFAAMGRRIA